MPSKQQLKKRIDINQYKDAVWHFLLEHCDVQKSGAIFVKFHMSHRQDFEKRVRARAFGYHRNDVVAKQKEADRRRELNKTMTPEERRQQHEEWIRSVIRKHIKHQWRKFWHKVTFGLFSKKQLKR